MTDQKLRNLERQGRSYDFRLNLIEPSAKEVFISWFLADREERASKERSEHGEAIYHVFILGIMKIKYYHFSKFTKLYLSAIILIY